MKFNCAGDCHARKLARNDRFGFACHCEGACARGNLLRSTRKKRTKLLFTVRLLYHNRNEKARTIILALALITALNEKIYFTRSMYVPVRVSTRIFSP